MNVQVTIGVTPELAKLLGGLTRVVSVMEAAADAPIQQEAPVQQQQMQQAPIQQQAPVQQQSPVQQQAPIQQTAVPTANPGYTIEQLAVAGTQLVDAGKREELLQLLSLFGVKALMELSKEQYGAFATELRGKGAKI